MILFKCLKSKTKKVTRSFKKKQRKGKGFHILFYSLKSIAGQ